MGPADEVLWVLVALVTPGGPMVLVALVTFGVLWVRCFGDHSEVQGPGGFGDLLEALWVRVVL